MNPFTATSGATKGAEPWSVAIEEAGRGGTVSYREAGGSIALAWEFGGSDVVAIIYFEKEAAWRVMYPWAADRRAEIVRRVAAETIRQKAPSCVAEIDEHEGWINLRSGAGAAVPPPAASPPLILPAVAAPHRAPPPLSPRDQYLAFRARKAKLMSMIVVVLLLFAAMAVGFKMLFSVKASSGTPLGLSLRTPEHIATLIQTLEPYVPSLHRDPANDRYRLALLLTPQDGSSSGKMILLAKQRRVQEFNLAKLLGCDGTTVWFNFNGIGGVNLKSGDVIGETDLRRANPALNESWDDQRRIEFDQRLRVTSEDRQAIYEVTPGTLQAVPASPRPPRYPFGPKPEDFLSTGVRPSPTEWLGAFSAKAAARDYRPGAWLGPLNRADDSKELRNLYRSQLGPELDRGNREILTQERVSPAEYLNAAFVRTGPDAEPLRLVGPDSFLMIFTSQPGLHGTLKVARVALDGELLWEADTGLDRFTLTQILPDSRYAAFIGTRLPIPGKVSEPLLVVIDTKAGAGSSVSLWR